MCKVLVFSAILLCSWALLAHSAPADDTVMEDVAVEPIAREEEEDKSVTSTTSAAPTKKKHKETFVEVIYGEERVVLGTFLNASQVKNAPKVEWKTEEDTYYTLAMLNLDVPTKKDPKDSDFLSWLVVNIPGDDITKGETLAEYVGGFPLKEENQNLMFILNQQPNGKITFDEKYR